ncbi:MAG: putative metal-binding motif-containing protein [Planctomycetes bacterium]|nr:putative metal-binding motif-containing protein [Planctomycetota bacterium]
MSTRPLPLCLTLVLLGLGTSTIARAQCEPLFRRGDSNSDGAIDLSDGIKTLNFLFTGGASPACLDAADANDSGDIDVSDGVFTFFYLFGGGEPPPLPGPLLCGEDPTLDPIACAGNPSCPEDCGCQDGETRPCGVSEAGECRLGVQTCAGGEWGPCEGAVGPSEELCDGLDDDCDGVPDDDFPLLGQACDGPDGDLCANGTWTCAADGVGLECGPESPSGLEESCDGLDNDCDGSADEGYDEDRDGFRTCDGDCDDSRPDVNPGVQRDPVDGLDNDCDGTTDEDVITTSHARDIQPIWDRSCSSFLCHDAQAPAGRLNLLPGAAYLMLVDRRSEDVPAMDRVEPFDPDRSYLWHKLNGTQLSVGGAGLQMPRGVAPLAPETMELIRTWILEGAPE